MKKLCVFFSAVLAASFLFAGCASKDERLEQRCEELNLEIAELTLKISELHRQKAAIENEIADAKVENGTARYVVKLKIKQSHVTLDIGEHIKDSMNEIIIEIPVDREFYESVSVGTVLSDSFRVGSLVMHGSFGSWKVTVADKSIR